MDTIIEHLKDPFYWIDSLPAIIISFVVVGGSWILIGFLVGIWNNILQFFEPAEEPGEPPINEGPSGFQRLLTCLLSILIFSIAVAGAVFALALLGIRP